MSSIISCPVDDLEEKVGYYIVREVSDPVSGITLLKINSVVSHRIIIGLKKRGIDSIYISELPFEKDEFITEDQSNDIKDAQNTKLILKNAFSESVENIRKQSRFDNSKLKTITSEDIKKVESVIEDILERIFSNPTASLYMTLAGDKDPYLLQHNANVAYLTMNLVARYRQMKEILYCKIRGIGRFSTPNAKISPTDLIPLGTSCLMHDIGKIMMMEVVTRNKKYDKSDDVWKTIKKHPKIGHDLLFGKGVDAHSLLGIKYHHENFNGTGYPYGIKGYKIHVYSRIIRIVDSWDAATTKRPGAKAINSNDMLDEMRKLCGIYYDQEIFECFQDMISNQTIIENINK